MGLFGRGKGGGLMNVIRCDQQDYLVWKWRPEGQDVNSTSRENAIRYGSSLRVKDGEVAVFVYKQKDGTLQDFIEGPYDDTIKTSNFPILTSIVGMAFGGESPFQAEIYFINLQKNNQFQFSIPYFGVVDPRLPDIPVPVSVHGTVTFALEDYRSFIKMNRLVDFDHEAFRSQVTGAISRKVKSIVTNMPSELGVSLVQLERKIDEVSDLLSMRLSGRMEDFGIQMRHIDVSDIIIDRESKAFIQVNRLTAGITAQTMEAQAQLNIKNMEDTQRLNMLNMEETMRIQREEAQRAQRLQSESTYIGAHALDQQAAVLTAAANNLGQMSNMGGGDGSGGGMNPAGMMTGMMMGGAMGGQMANMMNMMGQQVANGMQAPPSVPGIQYMLVIGGQQAGPFDMQQMQQMVATGQMTKDTYAWKQGMAQWEFAGTIAELAPLFAAPAPPPIPGSMPPVPPTPPTP